MASSSKAPPIDPFSLSALSDQLQGLGIGSSGSIFRFSTYKEEQIKKSLRGLVQKSQSRNRAERIPSQDELASDRSETDGMISCLVEATKRNEQLEVLLHVYDKMSDSGSTVSSLLPRKKKRSKLSKAVEEVYGFSLDSLSDAVLHSAFNITPGGSDHLSTVIRLAREACDHSKPARYISDLSDALKDRGPFPQHPSLAVSKKFRNSTAALQSHSAANTKLLYDIKEATDWAVILDDHDVLLQFKLWRKHKLVKLLTANAGMLGINQDSSNPRFHDYLADIVGYDSNGDLVESSASSFTRMSCCARINECLLACLLASLGFPPDLPFVRMPIFR